MKRKRVMILLGMILGGMVLFLSHWKSSEEMGLKNKLYVMELTCNSDLPIQLMKKIDLTEKEREDPFTYYDSYFFQFAEDTTAYVGTYPYPYYKSKNVYIYLISIHDDNYNVLGLSIGDDIEKVKKIMKQYGYIKNIFYLPYTSYKKGDMHIDFDMTLDNHIEKMTISVYRDTPLLDITID